MKKILTLALAAAVGIFALAACTNTVATQSLSGGGEVAVVESDLGTIEQTVNPTEGTTETAQADYKELTVTYTDPDGYTKTVDAGGVVTYTLDGVEVGQILYIPETVQAAVMDEFYAALQTEGEELKAYAQQFAQDFDADFDVTKTTVNGYDALLITGMLVGPAENGAEAMALVVPIGNQIITIKGIADDATAEQIKADFNEFAGSIQVSDPASSMAVSSMASSSMAASSTAAT